MRKTLSIAALAIFIGAAANAQAQSGSAAPADQRGASQPNNGSTGTATVPKPKDTQQRGESGPPYSSCYMKCINDGNPADYCSVTVNQRCD